MRYCAVAAVRMVKSMTAQVVGGKAHHQDMTDSVFKFTIGSAPREDDFYAQVDAIKQVADWDGRLWHCSVNPADTERLAVVANHLFEVARQYGTFVRIEATSSDPSSSPPEASGHSPS